MQGIRRKIYYDILSPEELHELYQKYPTVIQYEEGKNVPPQERNILSRRRNKAILSLLVHQGLRVEEVEALKLQDLQLREGKVTIHSQRRTEARVMKLESHQVFELMDFVQQVRKEFSQVHGTTDSLFIQWKKGEKFYNITQMMLAHLRRLNTRIKNFDQIRASVITAWLKQYDLRKLQYLAGHKYVSSTEDYKANVIDDCRKTSESSIRFKVK